MTSMHNIPQPKWLIHDLIFERQIGVAYAPPGSYKSFVALALSSLLVHGMQWQGRRLRRSRVIYVAGEGFPMFYNRRLAWFKYHNMTPVDDGLEVINQSVDLTSLENVDEFIREMQRDCEGLGLVVFDTLSTCIAGQNESDSAVMTLAIECVKRIARELNCAVLLIHHPGKDVSRGARGHSSLLGNIDTEWAIERFDGQRAGATLTVTKQKDAEHLQKFHFAAHKVPLGFTDDDGIEMSSLALDVVAEPSTSSISQEITDRIQLAELLEPDEPVSTNQLAEIFARRIQMSERTARRRIEAAIPDIWTPVRRSDGVVQIRRASQGTTKPTLIEIKRM